IAGDVVVGTEAAEVIRRADDQAAAGEALAHVVIGFAHQIERDAVRQESPEALPRRAVELNVDRVVGQTFVAVAAGNFARQHGADAAVSVAYRHDERDLVAALERSTAA